MKRRSFLKSALAVAPLAAYSQSAKADTSKRAIRVAAGDDRFGEHLKLGGVSPNDCKVSSKDTNGVMCIFESGGVGKGGPPTHFHHDQDEWFYVMEGTYAFQVGSEKFQLKPGDCVLAPRKLPHVWTHVGDGAGKM
jgi:mannose-6-phosphate isomerase-like protein (cupin superfamily)